MKKLMLLMIGLVFFLKLSCKKQEIQNENYNLNDSVVTNDTVYDTMNTVPMTTPATPVDTVSTTYDTTNMRNPAKSVDSLDR